MQLHYFEEHGLRRLQGEYISFLNLRRKYVSFPNFDKYLLSLSFERSTFAQLDHRLNEDKYLNVFFQVALFTCKVAKAHFNTLFSAFPDPGVARHLRRTSLLTPLRSHVKFHGLT